MAFANLIVSTQSINKSAYALYLQFRERLNAQSITNRSIFDKAITTYIKSEELRLKKLKAKLQKKCDKLSIGEQSVVEEFADSKEKNQVLIPRIIVFGQFLQSKDEIFRLFQAAFEKQGIELLKQIVAMAVNRDYNKAKRNYSKLSRPIQRREVDYFLFGPHPHSIRSRYGMDKWEEYFDAGDQVVLGDYSRMLSNNALMKNIAIIVEDWKEKLSQ